jgi:transposase
MAEERVVLRRRHSAQLRTLVLAQCAVPGASVAKVAMTHELNANLVHGWRKLARECDAAVVVPATCPAAEPAKPAAGMPQFMPVSLKSSLSPPPLTPASADIQIELRRGATAVKITWPVAVAADCAAWMRELLR